jgi:xylulokinase
MAAGYARQCGLRPGVPLVAGAGDTAASIYGTGMFDPGTALDCAGTASVFCAVADHYAPDTERRTLTMMRSPEENRWYPLSYIAGGGLCLRWLRDELGGEDCATYAQLEAAAAQVRPGCNGLLFAPHFAGRALPYDPDMKGAFLGLGWKHTRAHLYRAVMESIAYEYAIYADALRALLPDQPPERMCAVGGGTRSALLLQIKSDVLGLPVVPFTLEDAALLGSAVIAAHGTGELGDAHAAIRRAMTERARSNRMRRHTARTRRLRRPIGKRWRAVGVLPFRRV